MHQSVHGSRPCVQPKGTCTGMKLSRREPVKTRPQAAKVSCGITNACKHHVPISDYPVYTRLGRVMVHCNAQGRAAIRNRIGSEAASGSNPCGKGHAAHGRSKLVGTGTIAAALGQDKPSGAKHIAGSPSRHALTKGHEPVPHGKGKLAGTGFTIAAALGQNEPAGAKHIAGSPSRHALTKGHEPLPEVHCSLCFSLMLGYARHAASVQSMLHACSDSMLGSHRRPVGFRS